LDEDDWFYYCHWHRDWCGVGNVSQEARLITLRAHLHIFACLARTALHLQKPFQLFLSLPHEDAGQDAVYMHTPNPHSPFPAVLSEAPWGCRKLEELLHELLPEFQFAACRQEFNYVAYAIGVGVPLDGSAQDA
jgi:hypothetical protein